MYNETQEPIQTRHGLHRVISSAVARDDAVPFRLSWDET